MDHYATLRGPVEAVFACLAAPARLTVWLPQLTRVDPGPAVLVGLGSTFTVTFRAESGEQDEQDLAGEVIAYEPPWLIGYRLLATRPRLLRATCNSEGTGTRLHIHQNDDPEPLKVDLARIDRAETGGPGCGEVPGRGIAGGVPRPGDTRVNPAVTALANRPDPTAMATRQGTPAKDEDRARVGARVVDQLIRICAGRGWLRAYDMQALSALCAGSGSECL